MPSRRKTREFVLQVLFAADALKQDPRDVLELFETHFKEEEEDCPDLSRVMTGFARDLVDAVSEHIESIDALVGKISHHWKLYRMSRVDRNVLRMAIAEMTNFTDIPARVSLNEAIDLSKRFGGDESSAFVNGVLDTVHRLQSKAESQRDLREIVSLLDEPDTSS